MTAHLDRIAAAVDQLRHAVPSLRTPSPDAASPHRQVGEAGAGPVPLAGYFAETGLDHKALPALTRGSVAEFLCGQGIPADDLGAPADLLAGFLFAAGRVGWAFVSAADLLPRRRFTAAHELGHFVLHRGTMGRFRADTDRTLQEAEVEVADQMEREANRFAAELLMPAELCQARAEEMRKQYRCCPRGVLVYRLASELLVSREAMRYRLRGLGVGDE